MSFIRAKLTLMKYENMGIYLRIFKFLPIIYLKNEDLNFVKCKNYTIGNFPNM
ncbi:MAG: hypothetical protein JWQ54_138 [Mucilaginibacter sp.]|nr:hypothetical protein [Mucilaginibacter sp.]